MLWRLQSSRSLPPALLSRAPSLPGCHLPRLSLIGCQACQLPALGAKARWEGLERIPCAPPQGSRSDRLCPDTRRAHGNFLSQTLQA